MEEFLSDSDLRELTPEKCSIFINDELDGMNSLNELFRGANIVYILMPWIENVGIGHWVVLTKYRNRVVFFDPYGLYVDDHSLSIDKRNITRLMYSAPDSLDMQYLSIPVQKESDKINTCGPHCLVWSFNFKRFDDIDDYALCLHEVARGVGMTPDEYVSLIVYGHV